MTKEIKKNNSDGVSRRDFLKDAGLLVSGTAIGSTVLLAACGDGETVTEKITTTVTGAGATTTKTVTAGEMVKTETITQSKYVCPVDGMEFDSLADLQAHFENEHGGEATSADLNVINLTINGKLYEVQIEPYWTLRHLLHDVLEFISVKDMCCEQGQCGSCAVLADGKPLLSCMLLAIECDGRSIQTAEGLALENHPLIEAYVNNHCSQCGYCTPGFIMTAKGLLDRNPNPTADEIAFALEGNLCRCSTYPYHIQAVLDASSSL